MAEIVPTEFTTYKLSPDEEMVAYSFSELQMMALRCELSTVAREKLNLDTEKLTQTEFQLRHEYLRGKMDFAMGLIELSNAIKQRLEDNLELQQRTRPQFGGDE